MAVSWTLFGLILSMFLSSHAYEFDPIAHAGASLAVEWLCKMISTVFEKFEICIEMSGEKRYDCIGSRIFLPTPKNRVDQRFTSTHHSKLFLNEISKEAVHSSWDVALIVFNSVENNTYKGFDVFGDSRLSSVTNCSRGPPLNWDRKLINCKFHCSNILSPEDLENLFLPGYCN